MLLMIEAGIRGGYSGVLGSRYVKANNKDVDGYDESIPSSFLMYFDANNLYGGAMSQPLPMNDFKWESDPRYFQKMSEGRGCIVECDLEYDDDTRLRTCKLPLAPIKRSVKYEELSEHQKNLLKIRGEQHVETEKLILDLHDKKKYVIHHRLLKYYMSLGLKVTKVHRTISFNEGAWLKPYIDFNTEQRTKSKNEFEKIYWKLMNNAFYGKTLENIRNRTSIQLIADENKAAKLFSKTTYKRSTVYNENLIAIHMRKKVLLFSKPIYIGMTVLDES
jgi:hypothetical protein